ncbi:MAG TPA: hypothetical protein VFD21_19155 [Vicinamibacterales bacterium]|jgi:hypothetical protein|nr:hypothetical protein [Vicinamibacterales bacterium]
MRQLIVVAALICASAPTMLAQWPRYRMPSVPRTSAGAPDLNAPAPRALDGKPDLSGIWENFRKPGDGPVRSVNAQFFDDRPPSLINEFRDIGESVKGGLPLQPWAAALKQQRMTEHSKDNPDAHCLPLGLMQLHTHPDPRRIVQSPSLVVFLYEANYGVRQIHVDGRPAPDNDPQPWWYGYSRGRWDGDTFVVDTTNFRDGGWLDVNGSPMTEAGRMTERFRRPNYGTLTIDITVDDPKAYTRPWSVSLTQRLMVDSEMLEFICLENEQSSKHYVAN